MMRFNILLNEETPTSIALSRGFRIWFVGLPPKPDETILPQSRLPKPNPNQRCRERKCWGIVQNLAAANVRLVRKASQATPQISQKSYGGLGGRTRTDLNRKQISISIGVRAMWLVRKGKAKVKHILKGGDSACRMMSTGGLVIDKYRIVQSSELRTCHMCRVNANKPAKLSGFEAKKAAAMVKYHESQDSET